MILEARQNRVRSLARLLVAAASIAWLAGCGAPGPLISEQPSVHSSGTRQSPPPEAYRVSRGDTLYSIAFGHGLDWRDVARWNGIAAPYTIHVGDWIRLQPLSDMRTAVVAIQPAPSAEPRQRRASTVESRPGSSAGAEPEAQSDPQNTSPSADALGGNSPASGAEPQPAPEAERDPKPAPEALSTEEQKAPPSGPTRSVAGVSWRWPVSGQVTREFDDGAARKGILIAGEVGQAIRAAASGQVVYSGNGLIGYGELIIIKHSERMLSAYAHNRERLVAESDQVSSGDVIARMGNNERAETVLHFEIRRDGKPNNPLDYLPRR